MELELESSSCVPPGFRFHPTDEELVGYYLKRKVESLQIDLGVIVDLDLYRMEPWDIQGRCKQGYEEQSEWFFFSYKDRKYPTGTRTNRATSAGFWKATGRDKAVVSRERMIIGMRKTLVFYNGRAPNGRKSDWIMHEYRLHAAPQEEGWVVCKAFKKPNPIEKQIRFEGWNMNNMIRPLDPPPVNHDNIFNPSQSFPFRDPEQQLSANNLLLDSPSASRSLEVNECGEGFDFNQYYNNDWKNIEDLLNYSVVDETKTSHLFGCSSHL